MVDPDGVTPCPCASLCLQSVKYETQGTVAVISLNRPEKANAQDMAMLYELNDAFDRACGDSAVKVILLRAEGKHFSSGHDLAEKSGTVGETWPTHGTWRNFSPPKHQLQKTKLHPTVSRRRAAAAPAPPRSRRPFACPQQPQPSLHVHRLPSAQH